MRRAFLASSFFSALFAPGHFTTQNGSVSLYDLQGLEHLFDCEVWCWSWKHVFTCWITWNTESMSKWEIIKLELPKYDMKNCLGSPSGLWFLPMPSACTISWIVFMNSRVSTPENGSNWNSGTSRFKCAVPDCCWSLRQTRNLLCKHT